MPKTALLIACLCCCYAVYAQNLPPDAALPLPNSLHSDQLRHIMSRLDQLAYEREYTELGLDQLRAEQVEQLVTETHTLLVNAGRLPEILNAGAVTGVEQETFAAVARQLYTEALRIQADVRAYQFDRLASAYQRLHHACNACHSLFRGTE